MGSQRNYTARIPIDAAGDPDAIAIPADAPHLARVVLEEESGTHQWTFRAPRITSNGIAVPVGGQKEFLSGPYLPGDNLGYGVLDSGSGYLILSGDT